MRYDKKLPCTMSIEFPTYEEMDADYKHLIDELQKSYISLSVVVDEESNKMDYTFQSDEVEYTKVIDESSNHRKRYAIQLFLSTMKMPQGMYDAVVQEMGEEFANKWTTAFGNKLTTIQTYVIVQHVEEQGKTIIDHGYELIPVTFKFKVNGVVNTDETIVPVLPIDDKGGLRPKFIDVMSSKDASYLPDKCHLDTFRELSKHHCIVFYDAELIELLRSIDSTAIEEIYIANYEDINVDGSNEDNYYYVKLPKSLYVIDNQCMIHDADDPSLPFDFGRLYEEYDIEISPYYFDKKDETYTGEVYAVVNKEKLGIEEVTGEMIVKTSWEKGIHLGKSGIEVDVDNSDAGNSGDENEDGKKGGTKAIQYLDQLYISPMWCNGQKDMSNMYFMPTDVYHDRMGIYPYVSIGNNGFTNWGYSEMSGFEAVINGVTYGKSGKLVLGFKLDGYPNSQYCCETMDGSYTTNLICGYWNPNEEGQAIIPTPQVVTAYILTLPEETGK